MMDIEKMVTFIHSRMCDGGYTNGALRDALTEWFANQRVSAAAVEPAEIREVYINLHHVDKMRASGERSRNAMIFRTDLPHNGDPDYRIFREVPSATPEAVRPDCWCGTSDIVSWCPRCAASTAASAGEAAEFATGPIPGSLADCKFLRPGITKAMRDAADIAFKSYATDDPILDAVEAAERARPAAPVTTDLPPAPACESDDELVARLKRETAIFRAGKAAAPDLSPDKLASQQAAPPPSAVIAPGEPVAWRARANSDQPWGITQDESALSACRRMGHEIQPLYLSPPPSTGSDGQDAVDAARLFKKYADHSTECRDVWFKTHDCSCGMLDAMDQLTARAGEGESS